jgi:hypothetical protein
MTSYSVAVIDRNDVHHQSARGLTELDEAEWLEAAVEQRLGIVHRPVDDEAV